MVVLLSYTLINMFSDIFMISRIKKTSYTNVSLILNLKWLLFAVYFSYINYKKFRPISI